jgi:hypothetical protein
VTSAQPGAVTPGRSGIIGGGIVFLIALAVRLVGITQDGAGDELYNVLAARQYLLDGTFSINGGQPYTRAGEFTWLAAQVMHLFGQSLAAARLPAVLAGALTALVLFLWLHREGHTLAGCVAGLMLAFEPENVILSDQCRFYTIQQLLLVLGGIGVYTLLTRPPGATSRAAAIALASLVAFVLATRLQIITLAPIAGMAVFALVAGSVALRGRSRDERRRRWLVLGLGVVAVILGVVLAWSGVVARVERLVAYADLWAASKRYSYGYYHWLLLANYAAFWSIFPIVLLLAATANLRLAGFAGAVFGVGLALHSMVAWKDERYINHLMPFFAVLVGLAVGQAVPLLARSAAKLAAEWWPAARGRGRAEAIGIAVVVLALGFGLIANQAYYRTAEMLRRDPRLTHPGMGTGSISWSNAAGRLAPLADSVEVVVATDDSKSLYYLGRLDYVLSLDHLQHEDGDRDFVIDRKVASPVIASPEAVAQIMRCHASGLIVAQTYAMQDPTTVPPATASFIAAHGRRVPLPERWGIEAFRWSTAAPMPAPGCVTSHRALP